MLTALRITRRSIAPISAAFFLLACRRELEITPTMASFTTEAPAECPATPVLPDSVHGTHIEAERRSFLLENGYCNYFIPEFHDEQRLTDNANDYGPIAYSYAHPIAPGLETHTGYDKRWVNVASVFVTRTTLFPAYTALNLNQGPNCVYLWHQHTPNEAAVWHARILPPDAAGACSGGTGGTVPVAFEQQFADAGAYPPVTRWMEGQGRLSPKLGVRCGEMWCIIGPGGAPLASSHTGHPNADVTPQWVVRGWHDDQTLGVPIVGTGSRFGILPTGPKISIVPHELLGSRTTAMFLMGWVPVATIIVPNGVTLPPKYGGLAGYGLTVGVNIISIRASGAYPHRWQARVTNSAFPSTLPDGGHVYTKDVKWRDHRAFTNFVPATARWRWFDNDEEIWTRCDLGCCMVQPQ